MYRSPRPSKKTIPKAAIPAPLVNNSNCVTAATAVCDSMVHDTQEEYNPFREMSNLKSKEIPLNTIISRKNLGDSPGKSVLFDNNIHLLVFEKEGMVGNQEFESACTNQPHIVDFRKEGIEKDKNEVSKKNSKVDIGRSADSEDQVVEQLVENFKAGFSLKNGSAKGKLFPLKSISKENGKNSEPSGETSQFVPPIPTSSNSAKIDHVNQQVEDSTNFMSPSVMKLNEFDSHENMNTQGSGLGPIHGSKYVLAPPSSAHNADRLLNDNEKRSFQIVINELKEKERLLQDKFKARDFKLQKHKRETVASKTQKQDTHMTKEILTEHIPNDENKRDRKRLRDSKVDEPAHGLALKRDLQNDQNTITKRNLITKKDCGKEQLFSQAQIPKQSLESILQGSFEASNHDEKSRQFELRHEEAPALNKTIDQKKNQPRKIIEEIPITSISKNSENEHLQSKLSELEKEIDVLKCLKAEEVSKLKSKIIRLDSECQELREQNDFLLLELARFYREEVVHSKERRTTLQEVDQLKKEVIVAKKKTEETLREFIYSKHHHKDFVSSLRAIVIFICEKLGQIPNGVYQDLFNRVTPMTFDVYNSSTHDQILLQEFLVPAVTNAVNQYLMRETERSKSLQSLRTKVHVLQKKLTFYRHIVAKRYNQRTKQTRYRGLMCLKKQRKVSWKMKKDRLPS